MTAVGTRCCTRCARAGPGGQSPGRRAAGARLRHSADLAVEQAQRLRRQRLPGVEPPREPHRGTRVDLGGGACQGQPVVGLPVLRLASYRRSHRAQGVGPAPGADVAVADDEVRLGSRRPHGRRVPRAVQSRGAIAAREGLRALAQRPVRESYACGNEHEQHARDADRDAQRRTRRAPPCAGRAVAPPPGQREAARGEEPQRDRRHLPVPVDARVKRPGESRPEQRGAHDAVAPAGPREEPGQHQQDDRDDEQEADEPEFTQRLDIQ